MDARVNLIPVIYPLVFLVQPACYSVAVVTENQGAVKGMVIGMHRDTGPRFFFTMERDHSVKIHIEDNIAVQQNKIFTQIQFIQRARGSKGFSLSKPGNIAAETSAVAKMIFYAMAKMTHDEGNAG